MDPHHSSKQHDTAYNASFTARGNLTAVTRWDVNDIVNPAKVTSYTNYYTTGTPESMTDALGHQTSITYTDSFSNGQNYDTFAYPTTITDPDSLVSTIKYNYDSGVVTRTQDPKGAVQTVTYDTATRIDRITNESNGAYVRYVYHASGAVQSYATIQNGAGEACGISVFDGAGRVRASAADNPGSSGGYLAFVIFYDVMGRVARQANPAEINASWVPTVDDPGWAYALAEL